MFLSKRNHFLWNQRGLWAYIQGCKNQRTRKPTFAIGLSLQDCTWVNNALVSPFTGLLSVKTCRKSFLKNCSIKYRCFPACVAVDSGYHFLKSWRHCRVILSLSECTGTSELPAFERALVVEAPVGWWLVRGWPNPDGRNPVPFDFFFGNFETLWILGLFHRIIPNLSTGAGFWNPQQTWGLSLHPWTGHFHNLLSSTGTMEWQRLFENTAKIYDLDGTYL